jgi:circadian clock protein KaiB
MKQKKPVNEAAAFERALRAQPEAEHYLLRLYVTGTTPRSARAIQNIRAICEEKLQGRYDLEVIDIYRHPEQAKPEQVVVTPTLVKKLPLPVRKLNFGRPRSITKADHGAWNPNRNWNQIGAGKGGCSGQPIEATPDLFDLSSITKSVQRAWVNTQPESFARAEHSPVFSEHLACFGHSCVGCGHG